MIYRYSPRPIIDYKLYGIKTDEVSVIMGGDRREAVWNLFWLSLPTLDTVPGAGAEWWRKHSPIVGALSSIVSDVTEDEVLYRKLMMHPFTFAEWFEREDHTIYDTYVALGGSAWPTTVLKRAEDAAARMTLEDPPVRVQGNVITVNFRRVA